MNRADSPHYVTMRQILETALMGDPFASVYLELAHHCLLFEADESPESHQGRSPETKYGGAADLPAGYVPPIAEGRRIWLLAQVDLSPFPEISSRWFGADPGVFYLFGRGKPDLYDSEIPSRRDFDLVADFWRSPTGQEQAQFASSSLVEAYLPEVKLKPVLGVTFPSWKFLDEYLDCAPPDQTTIIKAFLEKNGHATDELAFDNYYMRPILEDMRNAGVPVDLGDHSLAMFTYPKSPDEPILFDDWVLGRWPRLVRIYSPRSLHGSQTENLPALEWRLIEAELYAAADSCGKVDLSEQRCFTEWLT